MWNEDLGHFFNKHLTIAYMDNKFHHFISWLLQHYT